MNEIIVLWGKEYKRAEDIADSFGLPITAFLKRFRNNRDIEECVNYFQKKKRTLKHNVYQSFSDICVSERMPVWTMHDRRKRNHSLEKIVTQPIQEKINPSTQLSYKGHLYKSKQELCFKIGLTTTLVQSVKTYHKVDWKTALEMLQIFFDECKGNRPALISRIPYVIYNDVWCNTAKEFSDLCNLPYMSFIGDTTHPFERMSQLSKSKIIKKRYPYFKFEMSLYCKETKYDFNEKISNFNGVSSLKI